MRPTRSRASLLVMSALALALGVVQVHSAGPTVWLLTFTIDSSPGYAVAGDGLGATEDGGPGLYKDYRLGSGQPDDVNHCVEASPAGTLVFLRLNRTLDAFGNQYCGLSGGTPRQFYITVSSALACQELWSHGYPAGPDAPCTFTGADKPRIRIANDPYAKKTTRTPVAFLSKWYDEFATSYELRIEGDASVLSVGVDPSMRVIRYGGSARLWRFEAGVRERAVADSFPLPFQITLQRTAQ